MSVRHDLIFWSNQFHSVAWTVCLCGLSFVKVIQIRLKRSTGMASVCVFGGSPAIRGALSLVFLSFLKPSSAVELPGVIAGSRSIRALSEVELRRFNPTSTSPSPSVGVAAVIADNYLCNVWRMDGGLSTVFVSGFYLTNILKHEVLDGIGVHFPSVVFFFSLCHFPFLFSYVLFYFCKCSYITIVFGCYCIKKYFTQRSTSVQKLVFYNLCVTVSQFVRLSGLSVSWGITQEELRAMGIRKESSHSIQSSAFSAFHSAVGTGGLEELIHGPFHKVSECPEWR